MRNLEGILIEYFITGSIALIWIVGLFTDGTLSSISGMSEAIQAVIIISLIYVIGMFIDFIGKGFTGLIMTKRDAKRANQAGLMAYNSEWAKQITMRSSRDRIARGAIINSILITVTLSQKQDLQDNLWITILAGCAITLIITAMWYRFKKLSDRFETHCHNYLQKINNYPVDKEQPIISAEPFASAVKPASSTAIPPC